MMKKVNAVFNFLIVSFALSSCVEDAKQQNRQILVKSSEDQVEESDYYPYGCDTYTRVYDKTERISNSESNRFIGIYGFVENDSTCWDWLYEEANNLVPPDTNITSQNTYFIHVKSEVDVKPVTSLNQLMGSDSLKYQVVAYDNLFGDDTKLFPFRK